MTILIHNQPNFNSFSLLNPFISPSYNTRCSQRTNTIYYLHNSHSPHYLNSSVSFHIYADDIQLYVKCTENFVPNILSFTITTIHNWLTTYSIFFNPIKIEAIFLHLPLRSKKLPTPLQSTLTDSLSCTQRMSKILV